MRLRHTAVLLFAVIGAIPLQAHVGGIPPGEYPWWMYWNPDPLISANLLLIAGYYTIAWRRRREETGDVRPFHRARAAAFAGGLVALVVALLSPVDALAGELLSVHMVQHMVLMNLAAPLIVLGAPLQTLIWLFPHSWRLKFGRGFREFRSMSDLVRGPWQPIMLWILYGAVLWVWHLPQLYEAAVRDKWVHDAQHLMFFAASCLFWRVMFDPIGRLRMSRAFVVLYLFTTSLHATLLGVYMALAPRLWYDVYAERTAAWGLVPIQDQQMAGYIMWMPATMMYALAAAILFARWLREEPAQAPRKPDLSGRPTGEPLKTL